MKKSILLLVAFISLFKISAQEKGNYLLIVNQDTIRLNLDETKNYKTGKENLKIKLIQPLLLSYQDEYLSFDYSKSLSLSKDEIEKGVLQMSALTSAGNGFILQKYSTINPTSLNALMIQELTKESVSYGYQMAQEPYTLTLKSGQELTGTKATLEYNGDIQEFIVATYGKKDQGILVISMINTSDFIERDKPIIDQFLNSLKISN